jgi:hypothetical protein
MKQLFAILSVLVLSLSFVACGSDDSSSDDGAATATDGDNGTDSVQATVTVSDWLLGTVLEGVELCINIEGVDCLTTDAEGTAVFDGPFPENQEVIMTADKEGYFPFQVDFVTGQSAATNSATFIMASLDVVDMVIGALGEDPNDEKGHLGVAVWGAVDEDGVRPNLSGASVELTTGTAAQGPKYYNLLAEATTKGIFDDEATQTSDSGLVGYFNVDAGSVAVKITAPEGYDCSTVFNGLPQEDGTVGATVAGGRVTYIAVFCDAI